MGGSFIGRTIRLNENCVVKGGLFKIADNSIYTYTGSTSATQDFISQIIIEGKKDIKILDCKFIYDSGGVEDTGAKGIMCYGLRANPVQNIVIERCMFDNCGVSFFNNTEGSKVINCKFVGNTGGVFNNETCYDYEDRGDDLTFYNGWKCCKSNVFMNNYIHNTNANAQNPLLWCSGIDGLIIANNYFLCKSSVINIYCGDCNVSLRNAVVENNYFKLLSGYKVGSSMITVCGLSWVFPKENTTTNKIYESNCTIKDNVFMSEVINYPVNNGTCYAISASLIDKLNIENNRFNGFVNAVITSNSRSSNSVITLSVVKGIYNVKGNYFENIYSRPVMVASQCYKFNIIENVFDKCAYSPSGFYDRNLIDIYNKVNVCIINNEIKEIPVKSGITSPFILARTADNSGNLASLFIIKGNTHYNAPFNGVMMAAATVGMIEGKGSLAKVSGDFSSSDYCEKGQFIRDDNEMYYCTKSGSASGGVITSSITGSVGDTEVEYSGNRIVPGMSFTLNTTTYKVLFAYTKVMYDKQEEGQYTNIVTKDVYVLDTPLVDAANNTSISTNIRELLQLVGTTE